MTAEILRTNLRRIIEHEAPKNADGEPSVRAWALARGLSPRTVHNVLSLDHAATLATVESVAVACQLSSSWPLLVPGYDPADPPVAYVRASERELYLRMIDRRAFGSFTLPSCAILRLPTCASGGTLSPTLDKAEEIQTCHPTTFP